VVVVTVIPMGVVLDRGNLVMIIGVEVAEEVDPSEEGVLGIRGVLHREVQVFLEIINFFYSYHLRCL
jgi:hypothetical protein